MLGRVFRSRGVSSPRAERRFVLNNGVSGRGRFSHLLIAVGLALAAGGQASAQYSIEFLPSAVAGGDGFQAGFAVARGISGNGQVIVGSTNIYHQERAVVWRREGGAWTQSFLPMANAEDGRAAGRALAASWDGSTIVGATGGNSPFAGSTPMVTGPGLFSSAVPAIWRSSGGTTSLDTPIPVNSGIRGVATGVSASGQAVAFYSRSFTPDEPAARVGRIDGSTITYLTPEGTSPGGNYFVSALLTSSNMSSDGNTVVGMRRDGASDRAFRWTQGGGLEEFAPPGAAGDAILTVSGDGSTFGGHVNYLILSEPNTAMIYRDGLRRIVQGGGFSRVVTGLSSNGYYGAGASASTLNILGDFAAAGPMESRALVLEGNRFLDLAFMLRSNGVDLPATVQLTYANAITPDGQTIVGVAYDSVTNQRLSFIATIPAPGAAASMGLGMLMLGAWRRR